MNRGADTATIRSSYRRLIRVHHPDVAGHRGEAISQQLNEAVRVLGSPSLRQEYDRTVFRPPSTPAASQAASTAAAQGQHRAARTPPPEPAPAAPQYRLPSARARLILLLSGLTLMLGWLIMVANRPLGDSVVGFPFLFAVFAFFVSVKYAVIGYPFSKGFLFNVMTIVLAALYWVPFVGAIMGGIGLWTLASAALFSAGSLLIAGRRIPLNV